MTTITRRHFLRLAGAGAATAVFAACKPQAIIPTLTAGETAVSPIAILPTTTPTATLASNSVIDTEILLRAVKDQLNIFPNVATNVWRIQGELLEGDSNALQLLPETYLGPVLRGHKGQRMRIRFENELDEESIIHWHGLDVPADMDGHPQYAVESGGSYQYEFELLNRAGTYWYHPHPHGRTGPQVYAGMAGFFIVSDDEEQALELPSGEYDLPLVLQDRKFNDDGQLSYIGNGMMDQMNGFLGDTLLVNGQPDFSLSVANRAYRLRLLNGSNTRIYKLGWEDGSPFTVIGTDGGLLEKPVERPYITLAPAERIELWVDFSDKPIGTQLTLVNLPFNSGNYNSSQYPILTVNVEREATDKATLPTQFTTPNFFSESDAVRTREVTLAMSMGAGWMLNGRSFEMTAVSAEETIQQGSLEIWEFVNDGGGMMSQPHPIHMHGESFQILDREIRRSGKAAWDTLSEGFVDEGWKDTVLVMPGERVRVLRRFHTYTGLFLYHCHNLEHEDMGMMRNFRVDAV